MKEGQLIAAKLADGSLVTGTITNVEEDEDEETSTTVITVQQYPDTLQWIAAEADQ